MRQLPGTVANDDGWIRITIRGAPYERGVSHAKQLLAADPAIFTHMFSVYDFLFREGYGRDIEFFYGLCDDFYKGIIKRRFPKIFREISATNTPSPPTPLPSRPAPRASTNSKTGVH